MHFTLHKTTPPWAIGKIKFVLFMLALVPLLRLIGLGVLDDLGANPIEFIERSTGTWALVALCLTLSLTPLRWWSGLVWPIQLRRMLGLFMAFYALLHVLTYVWLDHWFDWAEIVLDIKKHPYVLVGFAAFLITLPLAVTSNHYSMKRLKQHWKTLHYGVYIIAPLAILHFWWLVKKDIREPLIYAVIISVLLGVRLLRKLKQNPVLNKQYPSL